jgi:hypothetical protein
MRRCILPLFLVLASAASFVVLLPRPRTATELFLARQRAALEGADAAELYRLAESHYAAGDRVQAENLCRRSLDLDPLRAGPAALLVELSLTSGRERAPAWPARAAGCTLLEIEATYEKGFRLWEAGRPDDAETEFRRLLEWAKWLPGSIELAKTCAQAEEMIDLIQARR